MACVAGVGIPVQEKLVCPSATSEFVVPAGQVCEDDGYQCVSRSWASTPATDFGFQAMEWIHLVSRSFRSTPRRERLMPTIDFASSTPAKLL